MAVLALASGASAQIYPPPFVPPPPPAGPSAANPDQRVLILRPDAPDKAHFNITSDEQESEGSVRHLRGHVKLETSDMLLEADEVDYDEDTSVVNARGHVRFESFVDGDKLECDHGTYNVSDETGIFYNISGTSPAKIQSRPGILTTTNPFYFAGEWAERKEDRYVLHNGYITDCKLPNPWWTFRAPKFDIITHDRAIAYKGWFHLRRVPLFYAPVFYKSLKKVPRQSGFLTPNVGHSSLYGNMFGIGYYWAINRSYDMLYRLQYFTSRGPASTFDFRGKVRPGTEFSFNLYGVADRGIMVGNELQKQGGYYFTLDGKSDLGHGFEAGGQVNYLSSYLFRQSFSQSFHDAVFSESRSVGYITKHWDTYGLYFVADRQQEFESTAPHDNITIRKLPEVQFLSRDNQILSGPIPLWFSFESSAGLLDRTELDFQTRRFVNREDAYPHLMSAFRWKGFSLIPMFSVRETQYGSSFQNGVVSGQDILRSAREVSARLTMPSLERIFKAPKWLGDKMKHVIEPRLDYDYVTGIHNFNDLIRFDENDIFSNTNELRFTLANRLFVKNADGSVREVLSWELSEAEYFDPTFGGAVLAGQRNIVQSAEDLTAFPFLDGPRHYSPVVSKLRLQGKVNVEWQTDYDPLRHEIVDSALSLDTRVSNYFFSVGHNEVRGDPILTPPSDQLSAVIGVGNQNRRGWNGAVSAYYDYRRDILEFATMQLTYNTDCCGISIQYRRFNFGTRDETQFLAAFSIGNLGSFGTLKKQERIF